DAEAVARGRALFRRARCTRCHAGRDLTNGQTRDVGTGGALSVPSLIGVADRLPVMHDGCADTLRRRFDPDCGGDEHGPTDLTEAQIDDLVAYLASL
ncbi:MAG TPA: cytochrome c, partial [Sandaracinaceae bacterium LLY-WYZ-13_1]|nr:cytochrome c [Sandaracinaceae bacterium LLY-WYZ-13_1]